METTKVISIGEERKKFKIIAHCSPNFLNGNQGNWSFRLRPLNDLGNSHNYNQCLIEFSKFIINLAPKLLFLGSNKIGSSLYFKVKPSSSLALSKVKNFS